MLFRKKLVNSSDYLRIPISEGTACIGLNIGGVYNANLIIEGYIAQTGQGYPLTLYDVNGNIIILENGTNTDVFVDVVGFQFILVSSSSWTDGEVKLTAVSSIVPKPVTMKGNLDTIASALASISNSVTDAATYANTAQTVATFETNRPSARLATNGVLPTNTYSSGIITVTATGVLTVDGKTVALSDDVVVKDEPSPNQFKNGVYHCTTAGATGVAAVLTRRSTENNANGLGNACLQITDGTNNTGWTYLCQQASGSITIGTTAITFAGQSTGTIAEAAARATADTIIHNVLDPLAKTLIALNDYLSSGSFQVIIGNRLYAEVTTAGVQLYKAILSASNTTMDDQSAITLVSRIFSDAIGGFFNQLNLYNAPGTELDILISNRLYATIDPTNGFYPRKATLPANTTIDDDVTSAITSRLLSSIISSMLIGVGQQFDGTGVLSATWANRLLFEWDKANGFSPSRMMIPSDAKMADLPTVNLSTRFGGGGSASANNSFTVQSRYDVNGILQIHSFNKTTSQSLQLTSGSSPYRNPELDNNNNVLFWSDGDGREMYCKADGTSTQLWPVNADSTFVGIGDSETYSSHPAGTTYMAQLGTFLAAGGATKYTTSRYGVGGYTADQIVALQGGNPTLLTFPSNQIPSGSTSALAVGFTVGLITNQTSGNIGTVTGTVTGTVGGVSTSVHGTLNATGYDGNGQPTGMTFTPSTGPTSTVTIPSGGAAFVTDIGVSLQTFVQICLWGRNGPNQTAITTDLTLGKAYIKSYNQKQLRVSIISIAGNMTDHAAQITINTAIQAQGPLTYVEVNNSPPTTAEMAYIGFVPDNYGAYSNGSTDAIDLANGQIPSGMRDHANNDFEHPNSFGDKFIALRIYNQIRTLGWATTDSGQSLPALF